MTTPKGGEGWETVQARNNDTARGHGVDVAPNPSPEGVRAETRRRDDGARGTPGSAPLAAALTHTKIHVPPRFDQAAA